MAAICVWNPSSIYEICIALNIPLINLIFSELLGQFYDQSDIENLPG